MNNGVDFFFLTWPARCWMLQRVAKKKQKNYVFAEDRTKKF